MQTPTTALGRVSDMFKAAIPGSAELATPGLVALVFYCLLQRLLLLSQHA